MASTGPRGDPEPPRDGLVLEPLGEQHQDAPLHGLRDAVGGLGAGREGGGVRPVAPEDVQQVADQVGLADDQRTAGPGGQQGELAVDQDHLREHLGQRTDLRAGGDELLGVHPGRLVEAGGVLVEAVQPDAPGQQGQVPGQRLAQRGRREGASVLGDQDLAAAGVDDLGEQRADRELVGQVVDRALGEGVPAGLEIDGDQSTESVALPLELFPLLPQGRLVGP